MDRKVGGARWRQLRERVLARPGAREQYDDARLEIADYRETLRMLDTVRKALGVSQTELARRLRKRQPTISRMLREPTDHGLSTVDELLRGLGLRGTLVIERERSGRAGLGVRARIPRRAVAAKRRAGIRRGAKRR